MAFRADYSKAQQSDSIKPEGDYECIVQKIEERTTMNGKRKFSVWLVIRNDVEQGYKNGLIFHDIWAKTPEKLTADDESVGGYNFAQLMALAQAVKLPQDKDYPDLSALIADMLNKPVKAHLYHNEYNGKTYEKIDRVTATNYPDVKHKPKPSAPAEGTYAAPVQQFAAAPVGDAAQSDDDYPF